MSCLVLLPVRDKVILKRPLFCRVCPLARPRVTEKSTWTPVENQLDLIHELKQLRKLNIGYPIIVDTYIFFKGKPGENPIAPCYGDEDNLRKAINDALVKAEIVKDDRVVIGGLNYKMFDDQGDWLYLVIYSVRFKKHELFVKTLPADCPM